MYQYHRNFNRCQIFSLFFRHNCNIFLLILVKFFELHSLPDITVICQWLQTFVFLSVGVSYINKDRQCMTREPFPATLPMFSDRHVGNCTNFTVVLSGKVLKVLALH